MSAKKPAKKKTTKTAKKSTTAAKKTPAKKPAARKSTKPATAAKKAPAKKPTLMSALPPRAPGEKRYWLVKTEPDVFSFQDLQQAPNQTTFWDGVRNYQARNYLRDYMKLGDGVLVYHSNAEPPGIVGIAEIVREGYPDHTQFDAMHHHYDPSARADNPTWYMVDIRAVKSLGRPLPLPELREITALSKMVLLQKGSRLSVQPVAEAEWTQILGLSGT